MDFKKSIEKVTSFYENFNSAFAKIDNLLQETTDIGGKNDDAIYNVVCLLADFQADSYVGISLSQERPEEYAKLFDRVRRISEIPSDNDIDEFIQVIKDLQAVVCNSLINDTDWQGQQLCINIFDIILGCLKSIKTCKDEQTTSYYAAVRILRELVADCSIAICALQPLSRWNYGTSDYAQLSAEEQLLVLINQAILVDRMYFCLYSLEIILDRVDKTISTFQKLDWNVYYVVGFLNFKIHNYEKAVKYFSKVVNISELECSAREETCNLYFRAMLFIAYSYEYSGEFSTAIQQIVIKPEKINEILKTYSLAEIKSNISEIMETICQNATPDSLFGHYINSFKDFIQKASLNNEESRVQLEKQFEILHAFGHCLNEYAIKHMRKTLDEHIEDIEFGKLLCLARQIMYELSKYRQEYLTCYATIHGEYQDYYQALKELDVAEKAYSLKEKFHGKETLAAEVKFFKYYFGLLCNQVFEEDKHQFEEYYNKYDDNDAECYLKIFEFRNELRKYLSILYCDIRNADNAFSEENLTPISENLSLKYAGLCRLNPTLYMNVNVRAELRLMQRAYICICKLREYLISPTASKLLALRNASYRFLCVKKDLSLNANDSIESNDDNLPQDNNYDDLYEVEDFEHLPEIVKQAFLAEKASILDCLFSSDSIFILAPISGVVVFQYQTGMISKLFDLEDRRIIPHLNDLKKSSISKVAGDMFDIYNDMSAYYDQRKLKNIYWDELKKYTDIIYYWGEDVPSQIIVANLNFSSYIRQIIDIKTFYNTLNKIKQEFDDNQKYHKKCTDRVRYRNNRCTLDVVMLPWLEIISETPAEEKFFVLWDDTGKFKCFIIPYTKEGDKSRHNLHKIIRNISIEYDSDEIIFNPEIEKTADRETEFAFDEICKKILPLLEMQQNRIQQKLSDTGNRIEKFGEDTENGNVNFLNKKRDEYLEQLQKIIEIKIRYENKYINKSLIDAKNDLDYLERLG